MLQDLRHAVRTAARHPGYFAAALLTLSAAIGFNTAIFTVVNGVLLRPLPYDEPQQLVILRERSLPQFPEFSVAPGSFLAWRAQATSFASIAAHGFASANVDVGTEVVRLRGERVSTSFFDVLRVTPAFGRTFTATDDNPGAAVVILSQALWRRHFASDPGVVGRTIRFGDTPRVVVGVMPPEFHYPTAASEFWIPLALSEQERRSYSSHFLSAVGRLKAGITPERAREELLGITRGLAADHSEVTGWEPLVFGMHDYAVRNVRRPLVVLLGAVAFVLLIACVNVANLLLARGTARRKEFAIRGALGAGRRRLVRQLAVENLLLGLGGAAGGLLLGAWLLRALLAIAPTGLPRVAEIGLDVEVFVFTILLSIATPLVFGLVPVIYSSRSDLRDALAAGGRHDAATPARRIRTGLVVGEMALALILLVGAGLLVRSFTQLQRVPLGFDADGAVIGGLVLSASTYPTPESRLAFVEQLTARLRARPAVQAVGLTQSLPLVNDFVASFVIEGAPPVKAAERPRTNFYAVTPGYFAAMGIRVVKGRGLTEADTQAAPHVVVINETLARTHFAGQDPIGRRIRVSQGPSYEPREIVGIAEDTRQYGADEDVPAQVYEPFARHTYLGALTLVVRTRNVEPVAIAPDMRAVVRELDRTQAVTRIRSMAEVVDEHFAERRFSTLLLSIFGAAAVGLAAVGLYAVLAYTVGQRRYEFAIRIAHGATRGDILALVIRGGLWMAAAGIAIGVAGAMVLHRLIESMLFNVSAADPATYVTVVAILLAVSVLAAAIPAYRATRVDPMAALRGE